MGYGCPVCEDPQADAGHLANHLAFTAILGDEAHGDWLDDHVPGWGEMDEPALADALRDDVEETEFPQVFEDTVGGLSDPAEPPAERSGALFEDGSPVDEHGHAHGEGHGHGDDHGARRRDRVPTGGDGEVPDVAPVEPADPADEETAAILEEAREMTREMMRGDERPDDEDAGDESGDDGASEVESGDDGASEVESGDDGVAADRRADRDRDVETDGDDHGAGNENG